MPLFHLRSAAMLVVFLCTLWAWWKIPSPRPRAFALAGLIAAIALPLEVYGYLTTLADVNNNAWYNAFGTLEFLLIMRMLAQGERPWLIRSATVGGVAAAAWCAWERGTVNELFIEAVLIQSAIIGTLLAAALWRLATNTQRALHTVPDYWLYVGMLVYFGGLPPMVGAARLLADQSELVTALWSLIPFLCVLRYGLTAFACHLQWRAQRTTHAG